VPLISCCGICIPSNGSRWKAWPPLTCHNALQGGGLHVSALACMCVLEAELAIGVRAAKRLVVIALVVLKVDRSCNADSVNVVIAVFAVFKSVR
jgi:hypothetical protein